MAVITFRCTSCNQGLKVGADKAGRKIKCSKCGTTLTIPAAPRDATAADATSTFSGPVPDAPPKQVIEDEDDDKTGYGLALVDAAQDEAKRKAQDQPKKEEKKAAPLKRKFKTLSDPDLWEKVKAGLQVMKIGAYIWVGAVVLMEIVVILGIINGPEYAEVLENTLTVRTETPAGEILSVDMPAFMLGLVTGLGYQGIGRTLYILAAVVVLAQLVTMMVGYGMCLKIPDRYGAHGQLKTLIALGGINFLCVLVFKLLPVLGIVNYVLVPYALPEVSLVDANIDRDPAIWVLWSAAPFWEMILNVLLMSAFYGQPVLTGVFIWSIGSSLREDPLTEKGQGVVALSFGIAFALLSYHLLTMAGTSGIALGVLRVVYAGWVGFTIMLLIRMPAALEAARVIIQGYLDGAEMKDEEDDAEDEDEEKKPKRKRKAKRAQDEEDDDT